MGNTAVSRAVQEWLLTWSPPQHMGEPGKQYDASSLTALQLLGRGMGGRRGGGQGGGGQGGGRLQLPCAPVGPCSRFGHQDQKAAARPSPTPALPLQAPVFPHPALDPPMARHGQHCHAPTTANANPMSPVPRSFHPFSLTQPSPAHGSAQPCEPQAVAAKPFAPRPRWEPRAIPLCCTSLIATTTYAFSILVPRVPPAPMALAAHIWKGFSRALKKALIKARLAAASAADLTPSMPPFPSLLPQAGQNRPHPAPHSGRNGTKFGLVQLTPLARAPLQLREVPVHPWGTGCGLAPALLQPCRGPLRSRQHRHAARSPQEAKLWPMLHLQAWEDGREHPPTVPEAAPAHTVLANTPFSATTTISFCSKGSCLAPARRRDVPGWWGTAGWAALGNSTVRDGTSDMLLSQASPLRHLGAQPASNARLHPGKRLSGSPVPLRAAPFCVSGDSWQQCGIRAQASIRCGAALIHSEVKHPLVPAAGTCQHPAFPNHLKVLAGRTRPLVAEGKVAAWQATSILASLQSSVCPEQATRGRGTPQPCWRLAPAAPACCCLWGDSGLEGIRPHPGILSSRHLQATHRGCSSCVGSGSRDRPRQRRVLGALR